MARSCDICGKGVTTGMRVSHSHIRNKRTWRPNIQTVRTVVNGTPKKLNVCTRCLRSGKVQRVKTMNQTTETNA
ncbi:MAG: 50S ribosomal protein L28 [Peptococcus niger]